MAISSEKSTKKNPCYNIKSLLFVAIAKDRMNQIQNE